MFRGDFEFHPDAAPSHLGTIIERLPAAAPSLPSAPEERAPAWAKEAEQELGMVPFFVRGKARRNTERFARERGLATITVETLYDAKAHFSR
jgi:light-independent protochlorophyllide reductase subunit B